MISVALEGNFRLESMIPLDPALKVGISQIYDLTGTDDKPRTGNYDPEWIPRPQYTTSMQLVSMYPGVPCPLVAHNYKL